MVADKLQVAYPIVLLLGGLLPCFMSAFTHVIISCPYRKLADVIEASGLDFTILRPDWFTNATEVKVNMGVR